MRKQTILFIILLLSAVMLLTGCTKIGFIVERLDNGLFVRNAVSLVNDHKEITEWLAPGDNFMINLEGNPVFEPYYLIRDFKASVDKEDDSIVHYSCRIPGLVYTAFNIAYERCFLAGDQFSPWVPVEGDLRIIKDEAGARKIDISGLDNVLSVYAALRYMDPLILSINGIDLSAGITDDNYLSVLNMILNLGSQMYAELTGTTAEEYTEKVVQPELDSFIANLKTISSVTNRTGYRMIDRFNGLSVGTQIGLAGLILFIVGGLLFAVIYNIAEKAKPAKDRKELRKKWQKRLREMDRAEKRQLRPKMYKPLLKNEKQKQIYDINQKRVDAAEALSYPQDRGFLIFLIDEDDDTGVRKAALKKLPYPEEKENLRKYAENWDLGRIALEKLPYQGNKDLILKIAKSRKYGSGVHSDAIDKVPYPEEKKVLAEIAVAAEDAYAERCALEKLKDPDDREEIMEYLLHRAGHGSYYDDGSSFKIVLKHFSYPEDRKELLRLVREAKAPYVREYVVANCLPYPEEEEILTWLLDHDRSESVVKAVLEKVEKSEKDTEEMLVNVAMNGKDPAARRNALEKLPYPKQKEVFVHAAKKDPDADNRYFAMSRLSFLEDRKILAEIAQKDADEDNRKYARGGLSFIEDAKVFANMDLLKSDTSDQMKGTIALTLTPKSSDDILRSLCRMIRDGLKAESKDEKLSAAGWAAAALGKILTKEMTPDDISPNRERFSLAIDHNNELAQKARVIQKELEKYNGIQIMNLPEQALNNLSELNSIEDELGRGLGIFMLDNGDKPFAWLIYILQDNQSRVPRFIRQGVIMGLLDWLMANAEHPEAKKLLETVVAVRAELIRSDNELSFFEVRVPSDCTQNEYARIFEMVLHTANPSIKFCNTKKLLELAETEVPGVMEMLRVCPLRLIDPVNIRTLGFYKFDPYIHAMWVQYQPPMDTGKVIARYHEVDDRTKPLSSGLNLQLFRDIYSVIPTLFHEYQHFSGDPNEASVFLKTQVFSIGFYKRHRTAKAAGDAVFARLSNLMGLPPAAEKCDDLNKLIEQYYGIQTSFTEANAHANKELESINTRINMINKQQTWDPEIKFPLLDEKEDKKNRDLLRDIIIRWDTVPKSITEKEFSEIAAADS